MQHGTVYIGLPNHAGHAVTGRRAQNSSLDLHDKAEKACLFRTSEDHVERVCDMLSHAGDRSKKNTLPRQLKTLKYTGTVKGQANCTLYKDHRILHSGILTLNAVTLNPVRPLGLPLRL
ncbi:hypothetical protein PoB_007419800 [Plakobranchus ocellatus]|uniref:Uncharacterized protein n=1 Tax=Plakobranchus ocellatus TaxID=259542 RepID=A0AAV4DUA0_9GAST|nr:hypothetical protein PoB_007419800 [Plakobranchus ocellatus]